ncbi:hypothetical protein [Consotaella salsifontis]|nr:hypothetical protein [Consotaella salsifontis]
MKALHETWKADGIAIAQGPQAADFGLNFLALDPDGHRIRVWSIDEG